MGRSRSRSRSRDRGRGGGGGGGGRRTRDGVGILVRNLPLDTRADEVKRLFEKYGEVNDVYLPNSGRPKGFGFVEFSDDREAQIAIDSLDRQLFGGRELNVLRAREGRKRPEQMKDRDAVPAGRSSRRSRSRSRDRRRRSRSRSRSRDRRRKSRSRSRDRRRSRSRSRSRSTKARSERERSPPPPARPSRERSPSPVAEAAVEAPAEGGRSPSRSPPRD